MANSGWVGKTLKNRYKIEELLGQGGMSAVYKASDANLKRVVAVKMIHPHLSDNPDFVRRFEEEATVVAQLRHPNIVQVYDFDHDEDSYYMVLEFIPGETLQARLARLNAHKQRLPINETIKIMASLCDAVDYAHKRGLVHRDIKPANIMLNVHGQAILMDFGIAKILGGQQHTATGAVVGTALYLAPELIQGERPDARTDIYSLGVTLFEMISGHPPFESDSAMTLMMMHVNDPVPDLRLLQPDTPSEMVAIIEKALEKKPDKRFHNAAEMSAALKKLLEGSKSRADVSATMIETPEESRDDAMNTVVDAPAMPRPVVRVSPHAGVKEPASAGVQPQTFGQDVPRGSDQYRLPAADNAPRRNLRSLLIGGAIVVAVLMLCVIGGGAYAINRFLRSGDTTPVAALVAETSPSPSAEFTATSAPTFAAISNEPLETPTPTPEPTQSPTPEIPPGIPYVYISSITINDLQRYVVEYQTYEYTPDASSLHIHFFFNNVTPVDASSAGKGLFLMYAGSSPMNKYRVSDKPADATALCALVANKDHTVRLGSGNCVDLPVGP